MGLISGFMQGLTGDLKQVRPTKDDLVEQEMDRLTRRGIRAQVEEVEEITKVQELTTPKGYEAIMPERPSAWEEYIGQGHAKWSVLSLLEASKQETHFPHILFWGEAGLGKTTLAFLIAKSLEANLTITTSHQLETKEELLGIFKSFGPGKNVLFIDEIHSLKRKITELLYSAVEDFRFDYITKTGQVLNLELYPFTLIGATTNLAKISTPLRQRFQNRFQLKNYSATELEKIAKNLFERMGVDVDSGTVHKIACRCRGVARLCVNFCKNLKLTAASYQKSIPEVVDEYFQNEGIDENGLTCYDREYIELLRAGNDGQGGKDGRGGKAGINTISKALGIDRKTIEEEIEPYLFRQKLIKIVPGGRMLV